MVYLKMKTLFSSRILLPFLFISMYILASDAFAENTRVPSTRNDPSCDSGQRKIVNVFNAEGLLIKIQDRGCVPVKRTRT